MDSGASSHMTNDEGNFSSHTHLPRPHSVTIGNGTTMPISSSGHTTFCAPSEQTFRLNHVLLVPHLVRNLLSIRKFTRDNLCSVEFDAFGFSVKDLKTRRVILRCNSDGDLYTFPGTASARRSSPTAMLATVSADLWHQRLGHPGVDAMSTLQRLSLIKCNKVCRAHVCHACQLGKHVRLPFSRSTSVSSACFDLIHCDLWTSPIVSISGFRYYLVIVDDYSHYYWSFPLKHKSCAASKIVAFFAYARTQFNTTIRSLQADNGTEFLNSTIDALLTRNGTVLRLSCPYTSQQNGKAERAIRTINDTMRTLLFHAHLPENLWAESLAAATYLLNRRPCKAVQSLVPYTRLHGRPPSYNTLRVFGCLCYPNTASTAAHKLKPRSLPCVFLGYPSNHRGYRCFDPSTGRILTSRHVVFVETVFPFQLAAPASSPGPVNPGRLDFLYDGLPAAPVATSVQVPANPTAPPTPAPTPTPTAPTSPAGSRSPAASRAPGSGVPDAHASPSPDVALRRAAARPAAPRTAATTPTLTTRSGRHVRPVDRLNLSAVETAPAPVPTTYRQAMQDPRWREAMAVEHQALLDNNTWTLVPRPPRANVVTGKWIFRHKFHSNGSLARYKARWVVRGYSQRPGIDYDETFSPVVKPATIRTVLTIATSSSWPIRQLDVKNAFLHGNLDEVVYCQQPPGFVDPSRQDHVCRLHKSLYGLKQVPRAWYQRFATYLATLGFTASATDTSLFVLKTGADMAYLLLYVDDIIVTASSTSFLRSLLDKLHSEFAMTDLGDLHFFLGIAVSRSSAGLFLSQRQYALDLLQRAGMSECHPATTPIDTHAKLSASDGDLIPDATEYRSLAGALQYLTLTRPDISYAVQQICLHMHAPRAPHLALIKRVLRYLRGTLQHGLHLRASASTTLTAYSDADWAGCPDSRRSTSGYCVYYGDSLISWSSKRQTTVSRSSAEAEYRAVAHAVAECCWLRQLLQELHRPLRSATLVYCDNVSAIYMSSNPVQHRRTKHIEIDIHFVRERVSLGEVRVLHVPSSLQFADVMTKGLPTQLFLDFRSSLCVREPPAATAGGC